MMRGRVTRRHFTRNPGFVVSGLFEADRKGEKRALAFSRGKGADDRGINPATEKTRHWHVRQKVFFDGGFEELADLAGRITGGGSNGTGGRPIARRAGHAFGRDEHGMSRRE